MAGSGRMTRRRRVAGKGRIAGRGRLAAPLLGGVGGWVYFHETPYLGINAKSFPEITLMQVRCYTDSRYVVNDSRYMVNDFRSW